MSQAIIAIFGGTGFLGRYTVKRLADAGYRLRIFSRHPEKAHHLRPLGTVGQLSFEYADINKPETYEDKLDDVHGIVNLVGILFEGGGQKFAGLHAQGAERIAQSAAKAGVEKLVHVSALGVDKADRSKYARTKFAGEKAITEAFPKATILRPSVLFGPEDDFFNMFACMARFSPALPLVGGGKTKFQPVYVDDVAKAICKAMEDETAQGKTYELGGQDVMSFKALLEYMLEKLGKKRSLVPLPFALAKTMGAFAQFLPKPPLTSDQVTLLKYDNVVDEDALTLSDLNIEATSMDSIVPDYLQRYVYKG